ncbi:MAG: VPLPA-CTERM-specific exosortase XrtD [Halioglobus sp.]
MSEFSPSTEEATGRENKSLLAMVGLLLVCLALMVIPFYDGFIEMEWRWANKEEYSYGYMIPIVALFLFYQKLPALLALDWTPTLLGPVLLFGALVGWLLGELSSLFIIVHYAFLLALVALGLCIFGWRGMKLVWGAFVYLIFMIPLPTFIYNGLSQKLQFVSTEIGVAVIKLFGISVYTAGNVIDLGTYQLQVVEACSGLRYLFPLMSFGFLIAYIFNGPNWQKWVIFLSTIVITILMNSFRIGVIGVTVEFWGIEMADGFLHDFEGWFVFMACLGVLFVEILILNYVIGQKASPLDLIDLSYPTLAEISSVKQGRRTSMAPLIASTLLLVMAVPASLAISEREELVPDRKTFMYFPLLRGEWIGRERALEENVLKALDYPDYIQADYRQPDNNMPVNFYVAYYESQRAGSSIHSPRSCIPGGGWKISGLSQPEVGESNGLGPLKVNRLVISQGENSQLVYYWFAQRGRNITNEYLAKWFLFTDGLTMSRSDGALVRVITPVPPGTDIADADARLASFLKDFYPVLPDYLPGATVKQD